MDVIFRDYTNAGYQIEHLSTDNQFQSLLEPISQELRVTMHFAAAQEHVPPAERNHRVIKERGRVIWHEVPFDYMPNLMIKILIAEVVTKLNFFPNRNGIPHFSPRSLLKQPKVNFTKHCAFKFGTYVGAPNEAQPYNTMAARGLDCIYLRPLYSAHGGHELLHLPTGRKITRHGRIIALPTPQAVINRVHTLAKRDKQTRKLKFKSKWLTLSLPK